MEDTQKNTSQKVASSAAAEAVVSDLLARWPRMVDALTLGEIRKAKQEWAYLIQLTLDLPQQKPLERSDEEASGLDLLMDAQQEATEGEAVLRELHDLRALIRKHLSPRRVEIEGACAVVCPICDCAAEHKMDCYWKGKIR